jgi:hypothetical protein
MTGHTLQMERTYGWGRAFDNLERTLAAAR